MKRRFGAKLILGYFVSGCLCGFGHQTGNERKVPMTVVVRDQANVSAESLMVAKQVASSIMSAAGFAVTWIDTQEVLNADVAPDDSSQQNELLRSGYLAVVIEPVALGGSSSTEAGFAAVTTGPYRRAYIFYDRVKSFAAAVEVVRNDREVGIVLGHLIVHEFGHLLIAGEAHTPVGIMRGLWDRNQWKEAAAGRLRFSRGQAEIMQNQVRNRARC